MKKEKERKHFIENPTYPGGEKALTEFIYKHLRYPKLAVEAGVEGTVYIEYDIDYQGNVVETRLLQSLGHGCDEEAARVVRMLKFDTSKYRGVKVLFHRKAKIHFRNPKQIPVPVPPPAPGQQQLTLNYTVVAPPATQPQTQEPGSFSYTIVI